MPDVFPDSCKVEWITTTENAFHHLAASNNNTIDASSCK